MNILMFGHKTVPSRDGGVEIVVEELATRMVKDGHKVTLFNRKRKNVNSCDSYNGISIKDIKTIDKKSLDAFIYAYNATKQAKKLGKKGFIDVVHIHAEGPCAFIRKFPKKNKRNYKVIVTVHGLDWQRGKWGGFATKFLKYCEKQAVKYADEIIVLSENVKKYFKETYNRETTFIPNGVNLPLMANAQVIKEKYNLIKGDYLLFLARIVPEKGLDYLIDAWQQIDLNQKKGKKLVIAGGSSHSDEYFDSIVEKCKNDKTIIMTGFVQGEELAELFSNAYLYVLPSDIEGMPMSLLEALAYGNRCLVSNIDENKSVITSNDFTFSKGDVTDLKEKIINIISNNIITHQKQIQVYSWDDVVTKTLNLYK